jgi:signal peptidase I
MNWNANKWVAALLGLLVPPLAMLYLVRPKLALAYLLVSIGIGAVAILAYGLSHYPWQQYASLTSLVGAACAVHAFKIASGNRGVVLRPWYSKWYGLAAAPLGLFAVLFLFRVFVLETVRMAGESMFPAIPTGALMVVKKLGYGDYATYGLRVLRTEPSAAFRRGDVIAFHYPKNPALVYARRVVGLPGDRVEFKDRRLLINGVPRTGKDAAKSYESLILHETLDDIVYEVAGASQGPTSDFVADVPAGHLFVLGDNRDRSIDSLQWGPVPIASVVGKVVYVSH